MTGTGSFVDNVHLTIQWPFGFLNKKTGEWGFFEEGQLRGYVLCLSWSPSMVSVAAGET